VLRPSADNLKTRPLETAMNAPAARAAFATANPHALATILEASETKSIIASRDIFDVSGTKLWARDQPVSQGLQRKLLDRQLRQPLESCLLAEDGITSASLVQAMDGLMSSENPLTALLRPHAARLVKEAAHVPLHPVAQLLLTAGQASRPGTFDHAVQAMALNGALMIGHGGTLQELRLAMLCGLLHDLGEMYIAPQYGEADAERTLDVQSYQHLVVHPHVGSLIVEQLTDYPRHVARAIAEHHERLDGSGYPRRLQRDGVSPLGRLLAVTEGALGALRQGAGLARASVALRVVPGEYDLAWVGPISGGAREQPAEPPQHSVADIQARLVGLNAMLHKADTAVQVLWPQAETVALRNALDLAQHLMERLRTGWNASGLWSTEVVTEHDAAEIEAIEDELLVRLWSIQRAVQLSAGDLPHADAERLQLMFESLTSGE
jgi:hypothetical protein